ncbi:MAG: hypothetical protein NVS3B24_18450 [Candidatus Dormibacteria bacterium]
MSRVLTCGEARNLASEMLDGELSAADEAAVKDHVASCQTCPGLYKAMVEVHARLAAMGRDVIPAQLVSGFTASLDHESHS